MEILKNFIVLEGADGAGTTTQLKNIENYALKNSKALHITCEPTTQETGKFIRRALSGEIKISQNALTYLFCADRAVHVEQIREMTRESLVVSDRYMFSTLSYQSIGVPFEEVKLLNSLFPYPEKIIYINTPAEECIRRINSRGEKKEIFEKLDFQKQVCANYTRSFENLPCGCSLLEIDGTKSKEEIFNEIIKFIF